MSKTVIAWIVIIILIIVGVTLYWQFGRSNDVKSNANVPVSNADKKADAGVPSLITAAHQFKNGKHIIAGEVDLPTPCHILTTDAMVAESMPEQVTIAFKSESKDAEICAQVITPERFKVEFMASKDAVIKATWNGQPAELNLVPVGPNEDLENFELFIKA